MDKTSVISIIRKPEVTDLGGDKVMVDFEQGKYFLIKGVGNDIWELLEDGITVGKIVESLLSEYEVSEDVCLSETGDFLNKLVEYGMITIS